MNPRRVHFSRHGFGRQKGIFALRFRRFRENEVKNGGSIKHPAAYIYIYIYMCCEVIIWAKFGHLKGYYLGQVRVIIWAKFVFSLYLQWFQAIFCKLSYHFVFVGAQLSANFPKIAFFKKRVQKLGFSIFSVF